MNTLYKKSPFWVAGLVIISLGVVIYRAAAVGTYVTELPFKGTFEVSCGYHSNCNPFVAGYGLDFVHATEDTFGKVAYASGRGTVTAVNDAHEDWGITIVITHPDLLRSRYAHLEYRFPYYSQKMAGGSPIGYMGETGNATGAHLHWQVYDDEQTGPGIEPVPTDGYSLFEQGETYTNNNFGNDVRVVDNTDTGFSLSGTATCWNYTQQNGYYVGGLNQAGVAYYRICNGTTGTPTRTGTWTPFLPSSGNYNIYIFAPEHSIPLTGFARYQIYSSYTLLETVTVNPQNHRNRWIDLGMYNLSTTGSYIRLTNQTGDGGYPVFDAVMFVKGF